MSVCDTEDCRTEARPAAADQAADPEGGGPAVPSGVGANPQVPVCAPVSFLRYLLAAGLGALVVAAVLGGMFLGWSLGSREEERTIPPGRTAGPPIARIVEPVMPADPGLEEAYSSELPPEETANARSHVPEVRR